MPIREDQTKKKSLVRREMAKEEADMDVGLGQTTILENRDPIKN